MTEMADVLEAFREAMQRNMHTAMPAVVVSYDASAKTANVKPACWQPVKVTGEHPSDEQGFTYVELPTIPDVPVAFPSGGGFYVVFPLQPGDAVFLVFSETPMGEYLLNGVTGAKPLDTRRHSLGYPIAIPGAARPDSKAIADSSTDLIVGKDGTNSQIKVSATDIQVGKGATDFVALASKVLTELNSIRTQFNAHVHVETGASTNAPTVLMTAPASVAATIAKAK